MQRLFAKGVLADCKKLDLQRAVAHKITIHGSGIG